MYSINLDDHKIIIADLYRQADAYRLVRSLKGEHSHSAILDVLFGYLFAGTRKHNKKS